MALPGASIHFLDLWNLKSSQRWN